MSLKTHLSAAGEVRGHFGGPRTSLFRWVVRVGLRYRSQARRPQRLLERKVVNDYSGDFDGLFPNQRRREAGFHRCPLRGGSKHWMT
jgi:hypothetical protein